MIKSIDAHIWYPIRGDVGHDGVCEGDTVYTPTGKVGGGLALSGGALRVPALLDRQPEFTLTGWVRREDLRNGRLFDRRNGNGEPVCVVEFPDTRCRVAAVNAGLAKAKDAWREDATPPDWVPQNEWFFVAVRLQNGGVGTGTLQITINARSYQGSLQAVQGSPTGASWLGRMLQGQIDEVAVFHRALTDAEVHHLYERGRRGTSLTGQKAKAPP